MLEAIIGLRRCTLDKQEVDLSKPLQRALKRGFVQTRHIAQQLVGEVTSQNRADLRHLTRFSQAVEACGERLLKRGRDALRSGVAAFNQQARHLLNEQRHAAGALADPLDNLLR